LSSSSSSSRRDVDADADDRFTVRGIFLFGRRPCIKVVITLSRDDDEAEAEEAAEEVVDGRGSVSLVDVAIISLSLSRMEIS
jgi:hypothetical protein|tara:strand:+ start:105 stop:350 length:246 start_codon:yes stop_codon:yes gene_type:complete